MNSFWKITRGELDKIFVRPAIFVMTGFFVLAIVVAALMFDPSPRADSANFANVEGKTVVEVFNNFNSNQHKQIYDDDLANVLTMLNFYSQNGSTFINKKDLTDAINDINSTFDDYQRKTALSNTGSMDSVISVKNQLTKQINDLNKNYKTINNSFLQLLITKSNNEITLNTLNDFLLTVSIDGDEQNKEHHLHIIETIDSHKFISNLTGLISKIEDVNIDKKTIATLKTDYYDLADTRKTTIGNAINSLYTSASSDAEINLNEKKINEIKTLCDNYKLLINQVSSIIDDKILLEIVGSKNASNLSNLSYAELSKFNKYKTNEDLTRNIYYFTNETYSYQYANVFQSNTNSNYKTNAFDFMYYALEFLSFIIIIFCVVIGSGMISGEVTGGTMKMLAIRPYRRSKIITGKLMGTFLMGVIFLLIGTITTFIIGARMYGLDSAPVLMIFNAESATTISATGLFFIFLALLLVRIIVYTTLAVFISTAFKSNVAAVIISVMIYIFVALFGNLFGDSAVYGYLPFANVDLFRYLGGEYVSTTGSIFGLDFSCPIQPDSNFYLSLGIVGVFVAILLVATYIIFNKRDIE